MRIEEGGTKGRFLRQLQACEAGTLSSQGWEGKPEMGSWAYGILAYSKEFWHVATHSESEVACSFTLIFSKMGGGCFGGEPVSADLAVWAPHIAALCQCQNSHLEERDNNVYFVDSL